MKKTQAIILRHKKENLKKCSLRGLEERDDLNFYKYPQDLENCLNIDEQIIVLKMGCEELSSKDSETLFLIDATWKYSENILTQIEKNNKNIIYRSIPKGFITAYPRKQTLCSDPDAGLASVEALYISFLITKKKNYKNLLNNYYWKLSFLERNKLLINKYY